MRGGKRENAGRKGYGKTKVYRLPIALEPKIKALLEEYKTEYDKKHRPKKLKNETVTLSKNESVTKSKEPIKPKNKAPTKEQVKFFVQWLTKNKFAKSLTEARKMTKTPILFKKAFLKYSEIAYDMNLAIPNEFEPLYVLYFEDIE